MLILLLISFICIAFNFKSNRDLRFWVSIVSLGLIVLIGSIRFNTTLYNYGKDILYFSKPVLLFVLGYTIINVIPVRNIVKVTVYIALILASIHIIGAISHMLSTPLNIERIRNALGRGYILEIFALIFILLKEKHILSFKSKYNKAYFIILLTSCLFYFSRTNMVILFVMLLFLLSYFPIKKLYYGFISIVFVGLFLLYNLQLTEGNSNNGLNIFFAKIINSKNEVFFKDYDKYSNKIKIHTNWRSYEAKCAIEQTSNMFIGNGFGSLVDIYSPVLLGKEEMQFIPVLHNGYVYLIFKTGVLGCLLYIVFIISQFRGKDERSDDYSVISLQNGLAVVIILTTFVVTGIYNKYDLIMIFLGITNGLQIKRHNNITLKE